MMPSGRELLSGPPLCASQSVRKNAARGKMRKGLHIRPQRHCGSVSSLEEIPPESIIERISL